MTKKDAKQKRGGVLCYTIYARGSGKPIFHPCPDFSNVTGGVTSTEKIN